jgi:hypothetical protein
LMIAGPPPPPGAGAPPPGAGAPPPGGTGTGGTAAGATPGFALRLAAILLVNINWLGQLVAIG